MFNILHIITQHKDFLKNNLQGINQNQGISIGCAFAEFYFLLPNAVTCLEKYLKIKITKERFINDLKNNTFEYFKDALKKYDEETDVYSDNFVELDTMEIYILSGLENCLFDIKEEQIVTSNFLLIIDILDYYENFSDNPEYWNKLLEEEIHFQKEIAIKIKNKEILDDSFYFNRYKNVPFDEI